MDGAKVEPSEQTTCAGAGNDAPKLESAVQSTSTGASTNSSQSALPPSTSGIILRSLKRPVLPSKDYEPLLADENVNQPSNTLYDYSSLEAWYDTSLKTI